MDSRGGLRPRRENPQLKARVGWPRASPNLRALLKSRSTASGLGVRDDPLAVVGGQLWTSDSSSTCRIVPRDESTAGPPPAPPGAPYQLDPIKLILMIADREVLMWLADGDL